MKICVNMNIKFIIITLTILFNLSNIFATGTISGILVDENGKPVLGGDVIIKGTSLGSNTDDNGKYIIQNVKSGTYTMRYYWSSFDYFYSSKKQININFDRSSTIVLNLKFSVKDKEKVIHREIIDWSAERYKGYLFEPQLGKTYFMNQYNYPVSQNIIKFNSSIKRDKKGYIHSRGGYRNGFPLFLENMNTDLFDYNTINCSSFEKLYLPNKDLQESPFSNSLSGHVDTNLMYNGTQLNHTKLKFFSDPTFDNIDNIFVYNTFILIRNNPPRHYFSRLKSQFIMNYSSFSINNHHKISDSYDNTGIGVFKQTQKKEINRFNAISKLEYKTSEMFKINALFLKSNSTYYSPWMENNETFFLYSVKKYKPEYRIVNKHSFVSLKSDYIFDSRANMFAGYSFIVEHKSINKLINGNYSLNNYDFKTEKHSIFLRYNRRFKNYRKFGSGFKMSIIHPDSKMEITHFKNKPVFSSAFISGESFFWNTEIKSTIAYNSFFFNTIQTNQILNNENKSFYHYSLNPNIIIKQHFGNPGYFYITYGLSSKHPKISKLFYNKKIEPIDHSYNYVEKNENLDFATCKTIDIGVNKLIQGYLLRLSIYHKETKGIIIPKKKYHGLLSYYQYENSGRSTAYGLDLMLKKEIILNSLFWNLKYSYSHVKCNLKYENISTDLNSDWDERHKVILGLTYMTKNEKIKNIPYTENIFISLLSDFGSGKPFSPVPEYYDYGIEQRNIKPNSERLPWTSNTDFLISKKIYLSKETDLNHKILLSFEIRNLFNKTNVNSVYPHSGKFYLDKNDNSEFPLQEDNGTIFPMRHYKFGITYEW